MLESISNWVLKNILSSIVEVLQQILTAFGSAFNDIFVLVAKFNLDITDGITDFTLPFSIILITVLAVKQYLSIYVFETSGDPDADPFDVAVRASQAIAVAVCADSISGFFLDFSADFVNDLQSFHLDNSAEPATNVVDSLGDLLSIPQNFSMIPAVIIIIAIGIFIALIVFVIFAGIRGAELTLFRLLFPMFAVDLLTTSRERWNGFFTAYLVTWLAYGLQLVSFKMFALTLSTFVTSNLDQFWMLFSLTIGWLILMIRAPRWLEKFAYSSGISNGLMGVARTAAFVGIRR